MSGWKFYYPDEGETADDARPISGSILDHEDAAQLACERDYKMRDGWERGDTPFVIAIIGPDGDELSFEACHEPSVEHRVYERS